MWAGRQVITGGVDDMILLFGKIAALGSRKCDYLLGCGVFFSFVSIKVHVFSVSTFLIFISPVNV